MQPYSVPHAFQQATGSDPSKSNPDTPIVVFFFGAPSLGSKFPEKLLACLDAVFGQSDKTTKEPETETSIAHHFSVYCVLAASNTFQNLKTQDSRLFVLPVEKFFR